MTSGSVTTKLLPIFLLGIGLLGAELVLGASEHWEIDGKLSEACSCQVPCGCNFGSEASPHHYCWSLMSLQIQRGHYGDVNLDGLRLAGAKGKKGHIWYIDDRATDEQAAALKTIALHILPSSHVERASIIQTIGTNGFEVEIGDRGGFKANYIIGDDGKNPITVENMTDWNLQHDVKGKTQQLRYRDLLGNKFKFKGTNANQAMFEWTDQGHYF